MWFHSHLFAYLLWAGNIQTQEEVVRWDRGCKPVAQGPSRPRDAGPCTVLLSHCREYRVMCVVCVVCVYDVCVVWCYVWCVLCVWHVWCVLYVWCVYMMCVWYGVMCDVCCIYVCGVCVVWCVMWCDVMWCVCVCVCRTCFPCSPPGCRWSQLGLCWGSLPSIQASLFHSPLCSSCRPGGPGASPSSADLPLLHSASISSRLPSLGRPSSSSRLCPSLVPVCLSPLHPHPPQHLSPFLCFPDFVSVSLAFCLLSSFFVSLSLPLSFRLALRVTQASTVAQW